LGTFGNLYEPEMKQQRLDLQKEMKKQQEQFALRRIFSAELNKLKREGRKGKGK
jgi:hypothetical protein